GGMQTAELQGFGIFVCEQCFCLQFRAYTGVSSKDMANLDLIKTIVVVLMENRSFDHMLGYRSLPPLKADVDGQSDNPAWQKQFANMDTDGKETQPFLNTNPYTLPQGFDPPHQRTDVAAHLGELKNG